MSDEDDIDDDEDDGDLGPDIPEIELHLEHRGASPIAAMTARYVAALASAGCGSIVLYSGGAVPKTERREASDLVAWLERAGPAAESWSFLATTADGTRYFMQRGRPDGWSIIIRPAREEAATTEWMEAMLEVVRGVVTAPGFTLAALHRMRVADFFPAPPLSRASNHIVTTNEREVAEKYDDPAVFWSAWSSVDAVGDIRICARALDALDVHAWTGAVFLDEMALARAAKPGLTRYDDIGPPDDDYAVVWEYGDILDKKGGYPALENVGYDPATHTVEYAGYCSKTPLGEGGEDPRDVLIQEIHEVRALVKARRDAQGRPVDVVRVVFAEEWMAREQRRPLLDVGARVYYVGRADGELVPVGP